MANKRRVFELAKQYHVTSAHMIDALRGMGFKVAQHWSSIDDSELSSKELKRQLQKYTPIEEKVKDVSTQVEIQRLKHENAALLKGRALDDKIIEMVEKTLPNIKPIKHVNVAPKKGRIIETLGMMMSDTHIGEVVDSEVMGGLAEYNFDIFKRRLSQMVTGTMDFALTKMQGYTFNKMVIWLLGDMVTGNIHEELEVTADRTVVDQVFEGAVEIAAAISEFSRHIPEIQCVCLAGNHGRLQKKKRFKNSYNNWDYVLYRTLRLMLKQNKRVEFKIPKSFWSYDVIEDHTFLSMHGDNVKSWGAYPHYGIDRMENRFASVLASKQKYIEYLLLAHFHSVSTMDRVRGEKIVNGSFAGGDEYSMGALTEVRQPKQMIFGVNPKHNRGITWRLPLTLD